MSMLRGRRGVYRTPLRFRYPANSLRMSTDPNFADDFEVEEKTEEELQEAFVRKSAELRRTTRELVGGTSKANSSLSLK